MVAHDIPIIIQKNIQKKILDLYYRDYPMQVDFNAQDYYNRRIANPMEYNLIKYDEGKHYYWGGTTVNIKRYKIEVNDIIVLVNMIGSRIDIDLPYSNEYKIEMRDGHPIVLYKPKIEFVHFTMSKSSHILLFITIVGLLICIV